MKDFTEYILSGAGLADVQRLIDEATPYAAPAETSTPNGTHGAKNGTEKNGSDSSSSAGSSAAPKPRRKTIRERTVDLADVAPPGELPLLFGSYLLKGAAHWLTGQTGLGKSTLLFNLSCALAEATPLWGIECEQTKVLYADMESGDVGRAHKIERLYQGSPRVRGQLTFLREPVKLPEELDDLLAFVQEEGIGLVIFDTARRCFSVKNEDDNAEVYNRVVPTLDALKQAGVASLTLGHPAKNGNGSARGAGAQEDAGDVNLSLTLHRGEMNDPDSVIALRVTKNRLLGLGIPPLYLKRIGEDQFERVEADGAGGGEETAVGPLLRCRESVLDFLRATDDGKAGFAQLLAAATASKFTKATLHRALQSLEEAKEIKHTPRQGYALVDPFADDDVDD